LINNGDNEKNNDNRDDMMYLRQCCYWTCARFMFFRTIWCGMYNTSSTKYTILKKFIIILVLKNCCFVF